MYETWPFFRSLLSNVDMVLSKSNMNIAFEYAKMCESDEVRSIFHTILDEWQLTKNMILSIEQNEELLAELPFLKASLDYRMPYFNVLNYIQIEWFAVSVVENLVRSKRVSSILRLTVSQQDFVIQVNINWLKTTSSEVVFSNLKMYNKNGSV